MGWTNFYWYATWLKILPNKVPITRLESALRRSYASTIWNKTTGWTFTRRLSAIFETLSWELTEYWHNTRGPAAFPHSAYRLRRPCRMTTRALLTNLCPIKAQDSNKELSYIQERCRNLFFCSMNMRQKNVLVW